MRIAALCALCAFSLASQARPASAILLAYEPFQYGDVAVPSSGQYAVGDENAETGLLGGQDPTIGPTAFYGGPWVQGGGDTQVVKAAPSLSRPNFPAGIGGVQRETLQFSCCTFGRTGRPIGGATGLGTGNTAATYYEGFLIDFGSQGTDPPGSFGVRGHELWDGGVGDLFRAVSLYLNEFAGLDALTLRVETASGVATDPVKNGTLTLPVLAGATHLVVMRYDFAADGPDRVRVYFDPIGRAEPSNASADVTVLSSDLFLTHQGAFTQFTFSGSGHVPGTIDEIRWATTYGEAITLPEPDSATGAPLGAGALIGLGRRRRRRS